MTHFSLRAPHGRPRAATPPKPKVVATGGWDGKPAAGGGWDAPKPEPSQPEPAGPGSAAWYSVSSYCILVLPAEEFAVTPASLVFLADHGMDISRLCNEGVRLTRKRPELSGPGTRGRGRGRGRGGNWRGRGRGGRSGGGWSGGGDSTFGGGEDELRLRLAMELCHSRPLVVHNGLIDCMFLYDVFVGPLPTELSAFTGGTLSASPLSHSLSHASTLGLMSDDTQRRASCGEVACWTRSALPSMVSSQHGHPLTWCGRPLYRH